MWQLIFNIVYACVAPDLVVDFSFKRSVLRNQAEVMAFVSLCDKLQFNADLNEIELRILRIKYTNADIEALNRITDEIAGDLSKYDRKALCLAGEIMYGPNGLNGPEMVLVR